MYFLSVGAIFKNESVAIVEWIEHYLNEGVDHFYLIDNGSTDDTVSKIQPYIEQGLVTLFADSKKWAQEEHYNQYFKDLEGKTTWLLVCDLDEFVYSRRGFPTITSFLQQRKKKVGAIRIPWKVFGSNGLAQQPDSIVQSFTKRAKQDGAIKSWMPDHKRTLSKIIVRPEAIASYNLHFSYLKKGYKVVGSNGKRLSYDKDPPQRHFQPISEKVISTSYLHLNHYAIQSFEWFMEVKATRGDANHHSQDDVRTEMYFRNYDDESSDIEDLELAMKKYSD